MTASTSPPSPGRTDPAGPLWRLPDMRRLAVVAALGFSSFFLTLASLPAWTVREGADPATAGLLTAVMLSCTIVTQMVLPLLQRRSGTPGLLLAGLIALGAPSPLYLVDHRLGWLVAVSAVRGVGFGILTVLGALISTTVAPKSRRGEAIGIYGLSIAIPNLVAVPAGTALTAVGHFDVVAVLAACPLLAAPLVRHFDTTAPRARRERRERPSGGRADVVAAVGSAALPSFVLLLVTLAGGGLLTFLPIAKPHGSIATIALLVMGVGASLSRWWAGTLHDRTGSRALMPGSLVAAAIGMALAGLALFGSGTGGGGTGRVAALLIGAAVFGIGYGAVQNISQVVTFDRAGPQHALTASSVWNVAFDGGTGLGAYAVGLVAATRLELPGTYVLCAVVLALALPVAIASARPTR